MDVEQADAVVTYCDSSDPTLVACYEFENALTDGSVHHLDPDVHTGVSYGPGNVGQALVIGQATEVDVAENSAFGVAALTIEAWIDPTQLPPNRGGILDCDGRYGFFLYANGQLDCIAGGIVTAGPITPGRWTHVACTSDGSTTTIYIDGKVASTTAAGPISLTGSQTGITLGGNNPPGGGDPLVGSLDELRLFSAARTAAQVCADSGLTTCL